MTGGRSDPHPIRQGVDLPVAERRLVRVLRPVPGPNHLVELLDGHAVEAMKPDDQGARADRGEIDAAVVGRYEVAASRFPSSPPSLGTGGGGGFPNTAAASTISAVAITSTSGVSSPA